MIFEFRCPAFGGKGEIRVSGNSDTRGWAVGVASRRILHRMLLSANPVFNRAGTRFEVQCAGHELSPLLGDSVLSHATDSRGRKVANHRGVHKPSETSVDCVSIAFNSVAFYTGAGLSAGAGIPSLEELETMLSCRSFLRFYLLMTLHTNRIGTDYLSFVGSLEHASPSRAHFQIAKHHRRFGSPVFTQNVDRLHEKTGIKPLRARDAGSFVARCYGKTLVVLGVRSDYFGIISAYRKLNPTLPLVVVDSGAGPGFASSADLFVRLDCQAFSDQFLVPGLGKRKRSDAEHPVPDAGGPTHPQEDL